MESSKCVRGFVVTASSSISSAIRLFLCFLFLLNSEILGLKCVCNPNECETIRSEDCPGRGMIVWDPCRCCRVCARTFGEACGGPGDFSGTCEPPLSCVSKIPVGGSGICLDHHSHLRRRTGQTSSSRAERPEKQQQKRATTEAHIAFSSASCLSKAGPFEYSEEGGEDCPTLRSCPHSPSLVPPGTSQQQQLSVACCLLADQLPLVGQAMVIKQEEGRVDSKLFGVVLTPRLSSHPG
ncbi:conserved hypothetical protein [Culex quinquefasciatus]|uniref:IGFBP N-terminal domain-containing protein n=1 Tax=Culex quinquefasciatus TaxID=7176 RepID=B0WMH5_CULQU|nr:conserved hypothetical protein [Culex quinquefasciatus]|eukprot:XP_001849909.1 conserved hypothetical protein [Culex quinquefasciatus]